MSDVKGHVRLRKQNNKWEVSIPLSNTLEGSRKRFTKGGFETKEEAENFRVATLYKMNIGLFVEPSKDTVFGFIRTWLNQKEMQVKPGTFKGYESYFNQYIAPEIGNIPLTQLTTAHIDIMYMDLMKKLSPRTIRHTHRLLSQALDKAVRCKAIIENPAKYAELPRLERTEAKFWTDKQVLIFLNEARSTRYYLAFLIAIFTGARQGEVLALTWKDINFAKNTISITKSIVRGKVGHIMGSTKTIGSVRQVTIPPYVAEEIMKWKDCLNSVDERLFNEPHDFISHTREGNFLSPRNFAKVWYKLLEKSKLPAIRFHDLRHTHATLLLSSGVSIKAISSRLGHSSVRLTLDTYSHIVPAMEDQIIHVLHEILPPAQ